MPMLEEQPASRWIISREPVFVLLKGDTQVADIVVQFRGTVYENGYGQIAQKVMRDKSIHAVAKAIYAYLVSFAGQDGSAFPSVELMMDELGIKSDDTFYKYRKQLIEAGYISIEQQQRIKGQFYNNVYIIEIVPSPKKSGTVLPHPKLSSTEKSSTIKSGTTSNSLLKVSVNQQVVVDLIDSFHEATGETISKEKMDALADMYGPEKIKEGINIISAMPEWSTGAEGALTAALRDGWKTPTKRKNNRRSKSDSGSQNTEKDERYEAFYKLFPDS